MTGNATRRLRAGTLFFVFAWLSVLLFAPRAIAQDGHGGRPETATDLPFGARIAGELGRADIDYFRLTVDTMMTVTVWTEGGTDTWGHLREIDGNPIRSDAFSGEGNNFRIEHDVGPGIYYVDVRGVGGATGDYVIAATALRHLSLPSRIAGEIRSSDESIWHPLTVDSPGIVTIWTEGDTNTWGRLRNSDGHLIAIDSDGGDGRNFRIRILLPAGSYFVDVQGSGSIGATGAYTLAAEQSDLPSFVLPFGGGNSRAIRHYGHRHYYRLNLDTPSNVAIWSEGSTDVEGRLLDAEGRYVTRDEDRGEGSNFRIQRALGPGTYYLEVEPDFHVHTGYFTVIAERQAVPILGLDSSIAGSIRPGGGTNWYRLAVETPRIVTMATTGGTFTVGKLLDEQGREIATDNDGGESSNFLIERSLGPGTYFLEVAGAWNKYGEYTVEANAEPVPHLPYGTRVTGQIAPAGDHYRITVDALMYVSIWTEGASDTAGVLYDENGNLFSWVHAGGAGGNFRIDRVLPPGTYYLGVREGAVGATGEYVLAAERQARAGPCFRYASRGRNLVGRRTGLVPVDGGCREFCVPLDGGRHRYARISGEQGRPPHVRRLREWRRRKLSTRAVTAPWHVLRRSPRSGGRYHRPVHAGSPRRPGAAVDGRRAPGR